jgi:hypothetical protein
MFKRISSLAAQLTVIFALAGSQAAVADGAPGKTLVGSWDVGIEIAPPGSCPDAPSDPPGPGAFNTTIVNRDGTLSNWDPALGTGNGIWRRVGESQFEVKFKTIALLNNIAGVVPGSTLVVTAVLTVDRDGMTAAGPFSADFKPDGANFFDEFCGIVYFSRMTFDD